MMKSVETEEDLILFKMHSEATKRGRTVLSLRACEIVDFSSQYGSEHSISYTAENILGPPSVFPRSGDCVSVYELRTYGKWWLTLPSSRESKVNLPCRIPIESQDFIEFRVGRRVEPMLIRIYEVYNPGAIVRILGYCSDREKWVTLWAGAPKHLPPNESHCFSVEFEKTDLLSDYFRIEFHHRHLNYYCELDSLVLYGEDKFSNYSLSSSAIPSALQRMVNFSLHENYQTPASSFSSVYLPDHHASFDNLPNEVIHLIISYLDLQSLCSVAQVSKLFHKICYDPVLYKDLNLQTYWPLVDITALRGLESRLSSLKTLNLSWCGSQGRITAHYFNEFVTATCHHLTALKLSSCNFVNNNCLKAVASHCPLLQELELNSCRSKDLTQIGFRYISEIKHLNHLALYRSLIDKSSIISIIKCVPLEHLFLGSCTNIDSFNEVARAIASDRKQIKTLDFWRASSLSCLGISELAEHCNEIVEIDLGWCHKIDARCGCIRALITRCTKLKKLFLSVMR
ncbi:F-box/LRR-repeat protein 4 isoform X1 [Parasteatoda tepidariorum]|uniref:F-box/LRR-repeat protein 4 isoform X1 n=1 Tax=Parasteatoda tepidariorum TaxID=114398 RepID=UPI001C725A77|nr:F-box/LRR-repeat protein 4 isoform X1 [Parasteatoda tepidariorum]